MSLVPAICPQCAGRLEVDNSQDICICPYCDTPIIIERAIKEYYVTNITNNYHTIIHDKSVADELAADCRCLLDAGIVDDTLENALKKFEDNYPTDYRLFYFKARQAMMALEDYGLENVFVKGPKRFLKIRKIETTTDLYDVVWKNYEKMEALAFDKDNAMIAEVDEFLQELEKIKERLQRKLIRWKVCKWLIIVAVVAGVIIAATM